MRRTITAAAPAAVIAVGIILADFGAVDAAPWGAVVRPIAFAVAASAIVAVILVHWVSAPTAAVATALVAIGALRPPAVLLVAGALIGLIVVRRWSVILLKREIGSSRSGAEALMVVGTIFAVINLTTAISLQGWPRIAAPAAAAATGPGGQSVYVLFLDGYPRADTLQSEWGIDNEPFLHELENRGFDVDRESLSLYHWTELAVGHLLGLDVSTDLHSSPEERRQLRRGFADAPLPKEWRAAGYTVTIVRTAIEHTTVDGALDTGQVTEFEVALLGRSAFAPLVRGWIVAQQRDRLDASLDALVDLARDGGSRVVIAHLLAPHPPFLTRSAPPCWPGCGLWRATGLSAAERPAEYGEAWRAQLDYVNPRVLATIDELIELDPEAAIIVFSDHGNRHAPEGDPEWNRNLYAVRGEPAVEVPVPVVP